MLRANMFHAGALLGHIPGERHIYYCLCVSLPPSRCFDVRPANGNRCVDVTE